jgi:AcrR family transcriptional regulator
MAEFNKKITPLMIIEAATFLAETKGIRRFARAEVAERLGVTGGAIYFYYPTVEQMHAAVIRSAIQNHHYGIIAQAIAQNDPLIENISPKLRSEALNSLK